MKKIYFVMIFIIALITTLFFLLVRPNFIPYLTYDNKGLGSGCIANYLKNIWMNYDKHIEQGLIKIIKEMELKGKMDECFHTCNDYECTYHGFVKYKPSHPDSLHRENEIHFYVTLNKKQNTIKFKKLGTL